MFVGVVAIFGGLIAYDIISNNRLGNLNDNQSNWNWSDDWQNQKIQPQVEPQEPKSQPKDERPKQQIVAQNYQDALKKSSELGIPVLVMFETDWCGWCKKMKQETLPNTKVKAALKNYIIVHVNTDNNRFVARKFGVRGLPSYVITNYREANLKKGSGYKDADAFVKWLDNPNLYRQPKKPTNLP